MCLVFFGMTLVCTNGTLIYSYSSDVNFSVQPKGNEIWRAMLRKKKKMVKEKKKKHGREFMVNYLNKFKHIFFALADTHLSTSWLSNHTTLARQFTRLSQLLRKTEKARNEDWLTFPLIHLWCCTRLTCSQPCYTAALLTSTCLHTRYLLQQKLLKEPNPLPKGTLPMDLRCSRRKMGKKWSHLVCCLFIQRNGLGHLTMALSDKEGLGMGEKEGGI